MTKPKNQQSKKPAPPKEWKLQPYWPQFDPHFVKEAATHVYKTTFDRLGPKGVGLTEQRADKVAREVANKVGAELQPGAVSMLAGLELLRDVASLVDDAEYSMGTARLGGQLETGLARAKKDVATMKAAKAKAAAKKPAAAKPAAKAAPAKPTAKKKAAPKKRRANAEEPSRVDYDHDDEDAGDEEFTGAPNGGGLEPASH